MKPIARRLALCYDIHRSRRGFILHKLCQCDALCLLRVCQASVIARQLTLQTFGSSINVKTIGAIVTRIVTLVIGFSDVF